MMCLMTAIAILCGSLLTGAQNNTTAAGDGTMAAAGNETTSGNDTTDDVRTDPCDGAELGNGTSINDTTPSICNRRHCPPYETLCILDEYEVRTYPSAMWVTTAYTAEGNGTNATQASHVEASILLARYITGSNLYGMLSPSAVTIPLTMPILTTSYPYNVYAKSLYLPPEYQSNPPEPTENGVSIEERPEMTVFVRSYTDRQNATGQQDALAELRLAVGEMADPDVWNNADYGTFDRPDAYSEVWMEYLEPNPFDDWF